MAKDRIRTPTELGRAQYHACFSYTTATALRLGHTNYIDSKKPLEPCTGVYRATTGLPCAHQINDI